MRYAKTEKEKATGEILETFLSQSPKCGQLPWANLWGVWMVISSLFSYPAP